MSSSSPGPLAGLRLVEFASIGPAPFSVMLLADLGVEVLRIERSDAQWPDVPIVSRGRASITLDLKTDAGRTKALQILSAADIAVEGYRPGVMERLGLGPEDLSSSNPRLIYARMTGWGQKGPLSSKAGHDINFIGLTGMLAMLSQNGQPPSPPLNLLGDYGGGGLYLVLGILAALYERERSGRGQVIDAAIVDGSLSMMAPILGMVAADLLPRDPAAGMLSGNAAYYRTYTCSDGRWIAVGALEPHFRQRFCEVVGIDDARINEADAATRLEAIFATRSRDEWVEAFADTDCCVSPVLSVEEAKSDPHLATREALVEFDGRIEPAAAPRFSRTPGRVAQHRSAADCLERWGVDAS